MRMPKTCAPVVPTGTNPVTEILPAVVTIDPPLKNTPWLPAATAAEVPFKVIFPPFAVNTPPVANVIPAFVVAPTPFAVKFIAAKPVDALVLVTAAVMLTKEAAVSVNVLAALQLTALETVIAPVPPPPDPTVEIVTLQGAF